MSFRLASLPREGRARLTAALTVVAGLFLTVCADGVDAARQARIVETYVLPPTSLATMAPGDGVTYDLAEAVRSGLRHTDQPGLGSGLDRDAQGEWFGLTDRGPTSQARVQGVKGQQRLLPIPNFAPTIARFALEDGVIRVREFLPLRDAQGRPLTGRDNVAGAEPMYASTRATSPLAPDPGGVDPESLRTRPDGGFVLGDEFGPSVLLADARGHVELRLTPKGHTLAGAPYPVRDILPGVLRQARANRGFENLALSRDGRTAYALTQSPLGDEKDNCFAASRVVRAIELDLTDAENPRLTGHFLIRAGSVTEHPGSKTQHQVKLNDAVWLGPRRLLLLEQARSTAALRIVDLAEATNLLGHTAENDLRPDTVGTDLAALGLKPADARLVARLDDAAAQADHKLEGLVVLGPDEVAVSQDNDFGGDKKQGAPTMVWRLRLPNPLEIGTAK